MGNHNRVLPCDEASGRTVRHGSCSLREVREARDSWLPKRQSGSSVPYSLPAHAAVSSPAGSAPGGSVRKKVSRCVYFRRRR